MSTLNPERSPNPYHKSIRPHYLSNRTGDTISTIADSFPALPTPRSTEKVNALRGEVQEAQGEIEAMQAKLRNLQALKDRHQARHEKNLGQIEYMSAVRERNRMAFEHKQKLQLQREQETQRLRNQADWLREKHLREKSSAQHQLFAAKANEAEQERRRHKEHEELLCRLKEMQARENSRKAARIKQFHELSSSRLRQYQESLVGKSRSNYNRKVEQTKQERERAKSVLNHLRQEEERLLQEVRASEQVMLGSLYSLQSLRPARKQKRFNSLSKFAYSPQQQQYSQEQFQS